MVRFRGEREKEAFVNLAVGDPIQISAKARAPFPFSRSASRSRLFPNGDARAPRRAEDEGRRQEEEPRQHRLLRLRGLPLPLRLLLLPLLHPLQDGQPLMGTPFLSLSPRPRASFPPPRGDIGFQYELNLKLLGMGLMGLWRATAFKSIVCFLLWRNPTRLLGGKFEKDMF
ncbi:hypothetical protein BT93_K1816 [Corymbia citriodora subsp. variegata]|nr:hypothetical protein BT93_K1816 [Corymbia citriodora subsp. variegata]